MDSIKYIFALLLMLSSQQAQALFLPGGVSQVNTDIEVVTIDVGC